MLVLAKSMLALMIGFVLAIICGLILIPLFRKHKNKQTLSIYLKEKHKKKEGTPTMGGFIFIIPTLLTILILILTNKIKYSTNLGIILFVFLGYALIGFVDDFLILKKKTNKGLTPMQKMMGQLVIALGFFYLFLRNGYEPELYIHTLNFRLSMGWFYGVFLLFILVASSNAVNLTDGLDGLAGGLSLISFLSLGLVTWNSTWVPGNEEIAIFCFILVGALMGFLFFNTHPARIFMGDTGSLSLGATMASVAILSKHEITFVIIAGVFIIETLSVILQVASFQLYHKRIFLMAPLHHHFEKLGWSETDIVKTFWVVGILLSMAAVLFAVWI